MYEDAGRTTTTKEKEKKRLSLALLSQLNLRGMPLTEKTPEKYEIDFRSASDVERRFLAKELSVCRSDAREVKR